MQSADAQIISPSKEDVLNVDSVKQAFEDAPYFSLYKDNYFIFGPSIGPRPTRTNTNVKFQISVAQRLTRSTLPGGSYLYLFYTQKCFWNVLEKSFPMTDLNFNPGIGITRPIFVKNRFIGKITLVLEHESNGRDSIQSRSWNKISLAANMLIDPKIMIYGKFWIPFIDGQNNRDLLDYVGIYSFGISYMPFNHRFAATLLVTKRKGWNFNYNTMFEMSYKYGTSARSSGVTPVPVPGLDRLALLVVVLRVGGGVGPAPHGPGQHSRRLCLGHAQFAVQLVNQLLAGAALCNKVCGTVAV